MILKISNSFLFYGGNTLSDTNNSISSNQILKIHNILRSLGLNTSHKGTKLLNKAIQYVLTGNDEFITTEKIYKSIGKYYNLNTLQIKIEIKYALDHRNENKTIKNFESIFGFEYDEFIFTNKLFIEEIARIIV